MTFKKNIHGELVYYTVPSFEKTGLVKHGFSTRLGGVSNAPLDSLNLGIKKKDSKENLYENYEIFCRALEIPMKNLILSDQIHEDHILMVGKKDGKEDLFQKEDITGVDGLI